jgi:hypothetical protein
MPTSFRQFASASVLAVLALAAGSQPARALPITYMTNLDVAISSYWPADAGTWSSVLFTTDNSAASFELNSLVINQTIIGGSGDNSFVALYSNSGVPGSLIETGVATAPLTGSGNYTYTFNSTPLQPNSSYFIVVGGTGDFSGGWATEAVLTPFTGNWTSTTNIYYSTTSGATWGQLNLGSYELFAVNATPVAVPEPGTYAVAIGAAALGLALWRRQRARA